MVERLAAGGVEAERHETRSLEDARLAACEAAGSFDAVVAMGGDGTVGACAAGLAGRRFTGAGRAGGGPGRGRQRRRPQPGPAPERPAGRGGLLAGLRRRPADLATVAGRAYLNVAGAGFDSEVNRVANQRLGWAGNRPRYVGAVLAELVVGRVAAFELVLDGRPSRLRGWLVAVANGPSYGGGMRVAPRPAWTTACWTWSSSTRSASSSSSGPSPRCSPAATSSTRRWPSTAPPGSTWTPTAPWPSTPTASPPGPCRPPSRSARRPSPSWPPTPPPASRPGP